MTDDWKAIVRTWARGRGAKHVLVKGHHDIRGHVRTVTAVNRMAKLGHPQAISIEIDRGMHLRFETALITLTPCRPVMGRLGDGTPIQEWEDL